LVGFGSSRGNEVDRVAVTPPPGVTVASRQNASVVVTLLAYFGATARIA
jgi:hypothetical protein